jgi:electron transfer flavoprotein alpha subunit
MSIKVLAIAEQKNGKISNVSYELITAAAACGGEMFTACLAERADNLAADLLSRGGGKILAVSNPGLRHCNEEIFARIITALIKKFQPQLVVGAATFFGKALFARLAAINNGAMASDITALRAENGQITITRPAYGGNVIVNMNGSEGKIFFVTIRPKIFNESTSGNGEVIIEALDTSVFESRTVVKASVADTGQSVNLTEADIIVAAGRGIRGPENLPIIHKLANSLKAGVGASRAIVDTGWIAYSHQVGQTGKTVNPKLYFAVGISGAIQHLVGMQTSKTIVAINRDKDAPIFNIASYGIVGDLFEIVPALTEKFEVSK